MSNGDWRNENRIIVAVTFAAFITILSYAIWGMSALHTKESISASGRASQYAKDTEQQILEACTVPELSAMQKCVTEKVKASEENQRATYDLVAQNDSAKWTFWMLVLTLVSAVFTGAGIFFVWRSLSLNRAAVDAAIDANTNTLNAINQEQANSERQIRAYVFVDKISIEYSNSKKFATQVIVTTKNFGQTPAKQMMIDFKIVIPLWGEFQKRNNSGTKTEKGIILAPGADIHTYGRISEAFWQMVKGAVESAKVPAFIVGKIEYVDAFSVPRRTWFRHELKLTLGKIRDGDNFATTEDGNDYT